MRWARPTSHEMRTRGGKDEEERMKDEGEDYQR
jgi:hypothetical protein